MTQAHSVEGDRETTDEDAPAVGPNLRRVRTKRGLSLERLSQRSGVSRAMLSQIELGKSAPTITVLWKIARSLGVPLAALTGPAPSAEPQILRARDSQPLTSREGSFSTRALYPPGDRPRSEFFELRLKAGALQRPEPRAPGSLATLVVGTGAVELDLHGLSHRLEPSDAILFSADAPHVFRNSGPTDAVLYLVVTPSAETD